MSPHRLKLWTPKVTMKLSLVALVMQIYEVRANLYGSESACVHVLHLLSYRKEFAPVIGVQDLDSGAVPLRDCPLFERLVGIKRP
jgi:hypothetical protein